MLACWGPGGGETKIDEGHDESNDYFKVIFNENIEIIYLYYKGCLTTGNVSMRTNLSKEASRQALDLHQSFFNFSLNLGYVVANW